jgi:hypothetical protein
MTTIFLVAAAKTNALDAAMASLRGRSLNDSSWIAYWADTADALCRHLKPSCSGPIVVCALTGDWSYR